MCGKWNKIYNIEIFKCEKENKFVSMLKYFDYILINKPGSLDAASGYYFMGSKCDQILSDRELINLYKGS